MNVTIPSLCLLATAHAFAQSQGGFSEPFPTRPPTPAPTATAPTMPTQRGVLFDARTEVTWAVADTWKASFDPTGVSFLPFLGASAPRNLPVHFSLHSVSIGDKPQPIADASVHREGATTTLDHGFVQERYAAQAAGQRKRASRCSTTSARSPTARPSPSMPPASAWTWSPPGTGAPSRPASPRGSCKTPYCRW
jgi:hypothetical protein